MNKEYDVIIAGGGLIGGSLLLALRQSNLNIALIEAKSPLENTKDMTTELDQRSLVLSLGSKLFYEDLGVWDKIKPYTTMIKKIIISEQGKFSKVFLDRHGLSVPALGYVINIDVLYQMIWDNIKLSNNIKIYSPYSVTDLKINNNAITLFIESQKQILHINGKIIVAADGGRSSVRDLANICYKQHDYKQVALIANAGHELDNNNIAYERFSAQGPFALLPRVNSKKTSGIVWPHPIEKLEEIQNLSNKDLLLRIQKLFGYKLGKFLNIGKRQFFPLWRISSQELYKNRIILLGNAANNLHPIGGQGFNLGLRDVKAFSELLSLHNYDLVPNNYRLDILTKLFDKYAELRSADHNNLLTSTDGLLNIFASDNFLIKNFRSLGMAVVNNSYILRNLIADRSMGLQNLKYEKI